MKVKVALHLFVWITLIGVYSFIFRANHPSITVDLISTSFLMFGSSIAVYTNLLLKTQKLSGKLTTANYILAMAFVVLITTIGVVLSIQVVYDSLVGPNPLRFGLLTNLVLDFTWIIFHLVLLSWLFSFIDKKQFSLLPKAN
jgi:hypothetical protein